MGARSLSIPGLVVTAACASVPEGIPAPAFPRDWLGTWAGDVVVYGPAGETGRFSMERIVAATADRSRFVWTTVYSGPSGDQTREYTLLVRDAATGAYAIDEHNEIVLEARLLDDTLYSWFEVQGTRLLVRERLEPGPDGGLGWSFEIVTTKTDAVVPTGRAIPVESAVPTVLQRAWLRRTGVP
ncbi:MAG: hypothetical protein AAF628_29645 [Planctomycetota bacterium]